MVFNEIKIHWFMKHTMKSFGAKPPQNAHIWEFFHSYSHNTQQGPRQPPNIIKSLSTVIRNNIKLTYDYMLQYVSELITFYL